MPSGAERFDLEADVSSAAIQCIACTISNAQERVLLHAHDMGKNAE